MIRKNINRLRRLEQLLEDRFGFGAGIVSTDTPDIITVNGVKMPLNEFYQRYERTEILIFDSSIRMEPRENS